MHKRIIELDQFGTNVKWRFQSKDTFKSYFGAVTFILLFVIFLIKVVFFAIKVRSYGFAKNQVSEAFIENYQTTNLTDLKFIVLTDLNQKLSSQKNFLDFFKKKNLTSYSKFNLSDFLEIQPLNLNPQLKLEEYDCKNTNRFKNYEKNFNKNDANNEHNDSNSINDNKYNKTKLILDFNLLSAKCFAFEENKNTINITKSETFLQGTNNLIDLQLDIFSQFGMYFKMDDELVYFLKKTKQNFSIYLFYSNFKLDPDDYQFHEFYSAVSFTVDANLQTKAEISFKKISVSQIIEVDIFDAEFLSDDKYSINRDSFKTFKILRENGAKNFSDGEIFYADFLTFNLNIWEEKNFVTILSTDDFLAVLGGFIEITFSIGEFFITMHNENLVRKIFNHFFFMNLRGYEENMTNLKNNVEFQRIYFCPFDKEQTKKKFKEKEEKVKSFFNKNSNKKKKNVKSINENFDFNEENNLKTGRNLFKTERNVIEKSKTNKNANNAAEIINFFENNNNNDNNDYNQKDQKDNNDFGCDLNNNKRNVLFKEDFSQEKLKILVRNKSNVDYCNMLTRNSSVLNEKKINEARNFISFEQKEIPLRFSTRKTKNSLENVVEKMPTNASFINKIDDGSKEYNLNLENNSIQDIERKPTNGNEILKLKNSSKDIQNTNKPFAIDPTKNKRSKLLDTKCDYSEIICIEKFLDLVSTLETLKSFLFDKLNKNNFEDLAKLHIYSDNFEYFKAKDEGFQFRLEKLDDEFYQKEIFKRIYTILDKF